MEVFTLTNDATATRFPQNNVDLLQYFAGKELQYRYFFFADLTIGEIRKYYKNGIVRHAQGGIEFIALPPEYHLDVFPPRIRIRPAHFIIEFYTVFPNINEIAVKRTQENALHHVVKLIHDVVYKFYA